MKVKHFVSVILIKQSILLHMKCISPQTIRKKTVHPYHPHGQLNWANVICMCRYNNYLQENVEHLNYSPPGYDSKIFVVWPSTKIHKSHHIRNQISSRIWPLHSWYSTKYIHILYHSVDMCLSYNNMTFHNALYIYNIWLLIMNIFVRHKSIFLVSETATTMITGWHFLLRPRHKRHYNIFTVKCLKCIFTAMENVIMLIHHYSINSQMRAKRDVLIQ